MATRYFSLDEAQALVPQVRTLLGQALQLHGHLRLGIARLSEAGHEITWAMLRGEVRLDESEDELDRRAQEGLERSRMLYTALRETVSEIEALGVEVKGVVEGLVDFHSWCDGEHEVLLCWKLGEPEIRFFHDVDDGYADRKSITGHRFTARPELRSQQSG
ncbi:MAG: DUF2203 domain-containing protein [Enhygromyxa sp.]